MMIPHFYSGLPAIADVATYFTRVVAAYALCVGLARLTSRPQVRFVIWASFLFGAGTYWVLLVVDHVLGVAGAAPLVLVTGGGTPTSAPSVATWLLPTAWRTHIEDGGALVARVYALGAILLGIGILYRRVRVGLILRKATPVSRELQELFDDLCYQMGVYPCRLSALPGLTSPATSCSWRPHVLVPESIESCLDKAQLGDVLCHELMHIRRRDPIWGTLADFTCWVAFFHPAIWLAVRNLHWEREFACDAAVIQLRHCRRSDYAECLTRLTRVRLASERNLSTINFARSASLLARRVRAVLTATNRPPWWRRGAALLSSAVLLSALVASWPVIAIELEFAPPPAIAVVQPGTGVTGHHRLLHRRRSRPVAKQIERDGRPTGADSESVPLPLPQALPPSVSGDEPSGPAVAQAASESAQKNESANGLDTAMTTDTPVSPGPVWSESLPQIKRPSRPSWRSAVFRAALDLLGRIPAGGTEGADGGPQQTGNHLVTALPHR